MNRTTPIYIIEEELLRRNLKLIAEVARRADVEIILAFKAFALWKTFPIFREYIHSTTASSLAEAKLAFQEFGERAHTYSPAYTDDEFDEIVGFKTFRSSCWQSPPRLPILRHGKRQCLCRRRLL